MSTVSKEILDKLRQLSDLLIVIKDSGNNTPQILKELAVEKCSEIYSALSSEGNVTEYKIVDTPKEENIEEWHNWILFILKGIEETSLNTIKMIRAIDGLMREYKGVLRPLFGKQYKHELLNNLFFHPYTKIEFIQRDMQVARNTASKYLDMIVKTGLVEKVKVGKSNYYFNTKLIDLFLNYNSAETNNTESIESISKTEQQ